MLEAKKAPEAKPLPGLGGQRFRLLEVDFGTAVQVGTFFGAVVVLEGLAVADGAHAAGRHALGGQVVLNGLGAVAGELRIVGIGALGVGPAVQDDALAGVLLDDDGGFVEDALGLLVEGVGVKGEVDAAEDDGGLGLAAEDGGHETLELGVVGGQVFAAHALGVGIEGGEGLPPDRDRGCCHRR